jgi:hypothetical protein
MASAAGKPVVFLAFVRTQKQARPQEGISKSRHLHRGMNDGFWLAPFPIVPEVSHNNTRVYEQHDQRSNKRHEPACWVALPVHARRSAEETAQPRTYQTQNHRQYQTHVLPAGHYGTSQ